MKLFFVVLFSLATAALAAPPVPPPWPSRLYINRKAGTISVAPFAMKKTSAACSRIFKKSYLKENPLPKEEREWCAHRYPVVGTEEATLPETSEPLYMNLKDSTVSKASPGMRSLPEKGITPRSKKAPLDALKKSIKAEPFESEALVVRSRQISQRMDYAKQANTNRHSQKAKPEHE